MLLINLGACAKDNPEIHRRADWAEANMDLIESVGTGPVELLQWLLTGEFVDDTEFKALVLREFEHTELTVFDLMERLVAARAEAIVSGHPGSTVRFDAMIKSLKLAVESV